jgi:hypothetical protein
MRLSTILAAATLATAPALAFPWMAPAGADELPQNIKRGLRAMAENEELTKQIRELYAEQKREAAAWKRAGKRDIVGSLVNGTIG